MGHPESSPDPTCLPHSGKGEAAAVNISGPRIRRPLWVPNRRGKVFCSRPFVGIRKLSFVQAKQGGVEAQLRCSTKAPAGEGVGVHMLSLA